MGFEADPDVALLLSARLIAQMLCPKNNHMIKFCRDNAGERMSWEIKKCKSCGREFRSERDFFENTSRWTICSQNNLWFDCSCESTLMLTKGKYPWYSPDKHMGIESSSVFNGFL